MKPLPSRFFIALALFALAACVLNSTTTWAQVGARPSAAASSALINEALDKVIRLQLNNSALPAVLESIEEQTGVPIRVADGVYDLLPYGTHTPITATIENLTLHDALAALAVKLGLYVETRGEYVELAPHPALRRIGRRVTLQELATLDVLHRRRLDTSAREWPDAMALVKVIDDALVAYDEELQAQKHTPTRIVIEIRASKIGERSKALAVHTPRGATLLDGLEAIAGQTDQSWYPWGDSIVVLPKRDVIRNLLERPADLRYDGIDIAQVFVDLARRTGLQFAIEPGAIQRVPPDFRVVKLVADAPVRQALESLQASTGLGYVITDDGVYIWNANSIPAAGRGSVVATVEVTPGTNVLIYEDELSPAARAALDLKREAATRVMEDGLLREGAATRPSAIPPP